MARQLKEPPEKRRKTDTSLDDDFWDDDNEVFSQAVLEDIDHIIQSQSTITVETNNNTTSFSALAKVGSNSTASNLFNQGTKSHGNHAMQTDISTAKNKSNFPYSNSSLLCTSTSKATLQQCPPPVPVGMSNSDQKSAANTSGTGHGATQFTFAMKEKLKTVEEENTFLKEENQKLKGAQYGKDGQIKFLRTKVAQLESEKFKDKQEKIQILEGQEKEKNEREKRLEKELENLKTLLQFTDHEVEELHDRCRRQDKQLRNGDGGSPVRPGFQSPGKAVNSQMAGANNFPTETSFMQKDWSPSKAQRRPASKVDKALQVNESGAKPVAQKIKRRLRLSVSRSAGELSGPQIVAQMSENPALPFTVARQSVRWKQGVFSLLQEPVQAVDISSLQLERDQLTLTFKPRPLPGHSAAPLFSPPDCTQNEVSPQSMTFAQQAIAQLLNQNNVNMNKDNLSVTLQFPHCTNSHAILLLPLIEEILDHYLDTISSLNKNCPQNSSSEGSGLSKTTIETGTVTSLTTSMQTLALQGASYVNELEARAACTLHVLHKLVQHSSHVRLAVMFDKHQYQTHVVGRDLAGADTMNQHTDVDEETKLQWDFLSQLSNTNKEVAKNCDLLNKILQLANPVDAINTIGNISLTIHSLQILSVIVPAGPRALYHRLAPLFSQECLFNCLNEQHFVEQSGTLRRQRHLFLLVTAALDLVIALVSASPQYLENICSQDDDCLLLSMYHTCVHTIRTLDQSSRQSICHQVFRCIGTILAKHRNGIHVLLNQKCNCSLEIIKCIVVSMLRELKAYKDGPFNSMTSNFTRPSPTPVIDSTKRTEKEETCMNIPAINLNPLPTAGPLFVSDSILHFLKQGLLILHSLTMRDGLFTRHHEDECRHEFVQLMCDLHRLLTSLPESNEKEMLLNLMPDLWDMDMDYPEAGADQFDPDLLSQDCSERSGTRKSASNTHDVVCLD